MSFFANIEKLINRKQFFIKRGENITEFKMNPKDVFVYNKEDITGEVVKKTNNEPHIGSIIQLDYSPRVRIYKHIYDPELDLNFWYCKYMSNNGRDAVADY